MRVDIYDGHPDNELLLSYQCVDSLFQAEQSARVKATQKLVLKGKRLWIDFTRSGEECPLTHINIVGGS